MNLLRVLGLFKNPTESLAPLKSYKNTQTISEDTSSILSVSKYPGTDELLSLIPNELTGVTLDITEADLGKGKIAMVIRTNLNYLELLEKAGIVISSESIKDGTLMFTKGHFVKRIIDEETGDTIPEKLGFFIALCPRKGGQSFGYSTNTYFFILPLYESIPFEERDGNGRKIFGLKQTQPGGINKIRHISFIYEDNSEIINTIKDLTHLNTVEMYNYDYRDSSENTVSHLLAKGKKVIKYKVPNGKNSLGVVEYSYIQQEKTVLIDFSIPKVIFVGDDIKFGGSQSGKKLGSDAIIKCIRASKWGQQSLNLIISDALNVKDEENPNINLSLDI